MTCFRLSLPTGKERERAASQRDCCMILYALSCLYFRYVTLFRQSWMERIAKIMVKVNVFLHYSTVWRSESQKVQSMSITIERAKMQLKIEIAHCTPQNFLCILLVNITHKAVIFWCTDRGKMSFHASVSIVTLCRHCVVVSYLALWARRQSSGSWSTEEEWKSEALGAIWKRLFLSLLFSLLFLCCSGEKWVFWCCLFVVAKKRQSEHQQTDKKEPFLNYRVFLNPWQLVVASLLSHTAHRQTMKLFFLWQQRQLERMGRRRNFWTFWLF